MSILRVPKLGPIVGHTTSHSCRLWIRAADPGDDGANLSDDRRTVGVITVLGADGKPDENRTYYFRLHREFDRTGTFNLGEDTNFRIGGEPAPLEPDTTYRVKMGILSLDDSFENDEVVDSPSLMEHLPKPAVWAKELAKLPSEAEATFRTFPEGRVKRLSFLVGSCRYPGILWKRKEADNIFGPMLTKITSPKDPQNPPRFVLMVGDQIYADMFNRLIPFGLADTYEEFQSRYLEAFGSRNMRKLLSAVPHYMILDDHEIEDNWAQDRIRDRQRRMVFNLAIGAYMSYQWSHGPRTFGRLLYYHFECGGMPFFVLDQRTQRYKEDIHGELSDNHLLGRPSLDATEPSQLDRLCRWLILQQESKGNLPKFIVSPSVFVPNAIETVGSDQRKNADDSWPAFPTTRRALLQTIVSKPIQNVVFLSGDIHCSCVAEISFKGNDQASKVRAFAITSSAFYWPFSFADGDPAGYVHDSLAKNQEDTFDVGGGVTMDYKAFNFAQDDNFCQVDVNLNDPRRANLTVHVLGRDGGPVTKLDADGAKMPLKPFDLRLAEI